MHGWLVLDKPLGLGSTSAVNRCRRLLDAQKAGHAGTLDPLASGVLPIAFGEATKCVAMLTAAEKGYDFTVRFGIATTSDDGEGEVVERSDVRPAPDAIVAALPGFTGPIAQVPPAFSAIKVEGERAYNLAREGRAPDLEARQVTVHQLDFLGMQDSDNARFSLRCSKGTYVRSLARDLGRALGVPACVAAIRRTRVGPFRIADAISLADFESLCDKRGGLGALAPIETALDDIPALALTGEQADRLRHGQPVRVPDFTFGNDLVVCAMHDRRPVALARFAGDRIEPLRVFNL
ncbi:MAG: tRNA pseudouridine(55) synthase TruB [Pseudomonadota bacterium]|nr:tRNA pseudouridine(55) synthase TruB [Pseudomonadota bacterium]